ncbi:MAG: hypothetical protein LBH04_12495 [Tannerellaceae bacterium]|nr:hypothetical protein [Tannerellaceae bacterium]
MPSPKEGQYVSGADQGIPHGGLTCFGSGSGFPPLWDDKIVAPDIPACIAGCPAEAEKRLCRWHEPARSCRRIYIYINYTGSNCDDAKPFPGVNEAVLGAEENVFGCHFVTASFNKKE